MATHEHEHEITIASGTRKLEPLLGSCSRHGRTTEPLTPVASRYFNTSAIAVQSASMLPGVIPATLIRPEPTM